MDQSLRSGRHIVELSVDESPLLRTVGDSDEKILAITLPAQEESSVILSKIIDGERLALLDSMGIGVAQFSLSGSGKAINGYVQCLSAIEQG